MVNEFKSLVFKLVARGLSGNDGNLYRYFFSTSPTTNVAVEGGNAFTLRVLLPAAGHSQQNHGAPLPFCERQGGEHQAKQF